MNQTLEGYTLRFWENIFRPTYIDLVRSVQSCSVYRYVATSAKHFSVANTSMDSVVNVTLNLSRRSNTILNRMIWYKKRKEDEKQVEKENNLHLPSAEVSWILEMLSRDSTHFSKLRRNPSNCVEYK